MRQWLYHKNADATIFHGDEAIQEALDSGWVDTPAKLEEPDAIEAEVVPKKNTRKPKKSTSEEDTEEETTQDKE